MKANELIQQRRLLMHNHPIIKKIQQSGYLPEIPKAFGETLSMLLKPYEFCMDECIEKLATVPNLEQTLIKALNYNKHLGREFVTLKDAVLYLGAKNTRMISIVYITKLLLPTSKGRSEIFDRKKYWKHCIGTSLASYMIAAETGLCDRERIFTYGLIHDIGITVLDICLPDYLDRIYEMQLQKKTAPDNCGKNTYGRNNPHGNRNVDMRKMGFAGGNH